MDDLSEATIRQLIRTSAFADGYAEGVRADLAAAKDAEIARLRDALRKIVMYTEPPAEGLEDPESLVIQWSGEVARAALKDTP